MSKPALDLSIIVPAYNEAPLIKSTLKKMASFLDKHNLGKVEIIIVAANSGDGTADLARSQSKLFKNFRVIEHPSRVGKGRDVMSGMVSARGEKVIFIDADLATPLKYIPDLIKQLDETDVAIGVRDIDTMHEDWMRLTSSKMANLAVSILAVRGIKDTQCGFKGFRHSIIPKLFGQQRIMGWGFDFEILALAHKYKMSIGQVRIHDWKDPKPEGFGLSGDSQFSAMYSSLKELLRVRWNLLTRRYSR